VAAEARCQELRCELRRAVGAVGVGLEQAVLDALHADNVEAAYELAVQQLEKVGTAFVFALVWFGVSRVPYSSTKSVLRIRSAKFGVACR
jgi:hypothetical protein